MNVAIGARVKDTRAALAAIRKAFQDHGELAAVVGCVDVFLCSKAMSIPARA